MLAWAARHPHLGWWVNAALSARAGRAGRVKMLVREPGLKHQHLPGLCRVSFGQSSKFSRAVWRGFEYFSKHEIQ